MPGRLPQWQSAKGPFRPFRQAGGGHGGADPVSVREVVDHVRNGSPTTATPQAARMAVAAGCKATESLRSGGGALEVPSLPQEIMDHQF